LDDYDKSVSPTPMAGNVFIQGAKPSRHEKSPLLLPDLDPAWKIREDHEKWFLKINLSGINKPTGPLVTSDLLGKTEVSALPFVQPDGSSYRLDRDYAGSARAGKNPSPGPFEALPAGKQSIQVWPASISP
jgi:alpha-N-arabinofuranosidase